LKLALTFDDGPSEWTEDVLELLREHDARATFFVIGARVRENPKLLQRIVEAGHEIGSHTLSHPRLTEISDEEVRAEVAAGAAAVQHVLGEPSYLFRAPGFHTDERVLAIVSDLGLEAVFADVDPQDWRPGMSSHAIFSHVFARVREGVIVDLHDGYPPGPTRSRSDCTPTVEALGHLLPCLVDEGYELVTVSELGRGDGLGG
jgi:peptidoglycan/xylan/chitin deacetylase (PgdA/CDA1 family)